MPPQIQVCNFILKYFWQITSVLSFDVI
jgi:hypothetical protein